MINKIAKTKKNSQKHVTQKIALKTFFDCAGWFDFFLSTQQQTIILGSKTG